MKNIKIAILGAGTAGLAAASFLKKSGHDVTLYEKFDKPKPLGAGLMLQPTGLAVLAQLGLDKKAIAQSCPIHTLDGRTTKTNKPIFDVAYATLSPHIFGLGIHRGTLFSLLYEEALRLGVPIVTGTEITAITYDDAHKPHVMSHAQSFGPYDLVIEAQGMGSHIRNQHATIKLNKPYPYAAVWGICKDHDGRFSKNALIQRYQKASHMIGVMPVGRLNGDDCQSVAFFWSLRAKDYPAWRADNIENWKKQVVTLWPETETLLSQFKTTNDLNFATYRDVILRKWHGHRIAFIGDAAHCTSPQLGQGANLALIDAMVLDQYLNKYDELDTALKSYTKSRKKHLCFYQSASRWLTPFFQSDSIIMPIIRNLFFGLLCKMPYVRTEMVKTLSGVKSGLFTSFNPGIWHKDYDLYPKP